MIKSEKEEELVLTTLMPYQLIHNLNAAVPIPTFYNFKTRKYSLNERTNSMPEASWFKDQIEIRTNHLRKIDFDHDIKYIKSFIHSQKRDENYLNEELIKEAMRILPELNFVLTGDAGYYSGHCITLPLKKESYKKAFPGKKKPLVFPYDFIGHPGVSQILQKTMPNGVRNSQESRKCRTSNSGVHFPGFAGKLFCTYKKGFI